MVVYRIRHWCYYSTLLFVMQCTTTYDSRETKTSLGYLCAQPIPISGNTNQLLLCENVVDTPYFCVNRLFHFPNPKMEIKNRASQWVSHNALFQNCQTHSVNDSIYDFVEYFWKVQWKIALWECCQHSLFLCCRSEKLEWDMEDDCTKLTSCYSTETTR